MARGRGDALHDLRVACRQLEASLRLWGRGNAAREAEAAGARPAPRGGARARDQVVRAMLIEATRAPRCCRKTCARHGPRSLRRMRRARSSRAGTWRSSGPASSALPGSSRAATRSRHRRCRNAVSRPGAIAGMRALVAGIADGGAEPLHMAQARAQARGVTPRRLSGPARVMLRPVRSLRRWQARLGEPERSRAADFVRCRRARRSEAGQLVRRLEALRRARRWRRCGASPSRFRSHRLRAHRHHCARRARAAATGRSPAAAPAQISSCACRRASATITNRSPRFRTLSERTSW